MSLWVAYLIKEDEVRVEDGYIVCRIVSNLPRELHNAPVVIQGRDVDHLNEESRGQDRRVILVEFDVQSVFVFFPNKEVLQDSAQQKKERKVLSHNDARRFDCLSRELSTPITDLLTPFYHKKEGRLFTHRSEGINEPFLCCDVHLKVLFVDFDKAEELSEPAIRVEPFANHFVCLER
jgi:hypothetical protein